MSLVTLYFAPGCIFLVTTIILFALLVLMRVRFPDDSLNLMLNVIKEPDSESQRDWYISGLKETIDHSARTFNILCIIGFLIWIIGLGLHVYFTAQLPTF